MKGWYTESTASCKHFAADSSGPRARRRLVSTAPIGQDGLVNRYLRKLHTHRSPPGLERRIWRRLPTALFGSVAIPVGLSVGTRLFPPEGPEYAVAKTTATVDIFAFATGLTAVTAVVTIAIGCIVVMIMKGPAYVADGYEINAADRPAPPGTDD
jgi:hypothetical protein